MRVLICVPTFENITPDTYRAIWDMEKPCECDFRFVRGYDCATARNKAVSMLLEGDWTHLLFVDNDVTPPKDALVNLLEDDLDVVSGYYAHRDKENSPTIKTNLCKMGELNYLTQYDGDELRELLAQGQKTIRIHGGGMGCILIKRQVFERMTYPWYDWINYCDEKRSMLSEDLYFCEKCKNDRIKIYADTRVSCGHLFRHIQMV